MTQPWTTSTRSSRAPGASATSPTPSILGAAGSARPTSCSCASAARAPPFTPDVVTTGGPHCALAVEMAKTRGALVLALEHRFYGPSQPTGDLAVASLRFLSS